MSLRDLDPIDLNQLHFEPLADRPSKVHLTDLGRPAAPDASLESVLDGLPDQLGGRAFRRLRDAIVTAHHEGRPVVAAMGGHVIKTGCAPI